MTPLQIIRKEYGDSRNFITPTVVEVGALPGGAYELSTGEGIERNKVYGVSVVWLKPDGSTERDPMRGGCYHSIEEARAAIATLRALAEGEGQDMKTADATPKKVEPQTLVDYLRANGDDIADVVERDPDAVREAIDALALALGLAGYCQNCGKVYDADASLNEIHRIFERVAPGEPMPMGECPGCGALVTPGGPKVRP